LDIICAPGFSTRQGADLTSGRGVGMAVVRSTIEELGGLLSMESKSGRGTKFVINLPLTLVIMDALLVHVGDHRFAVPQSGVREIVAVEKSEIRRIENNDLIPYRGGVLPVLRVSELLTFSNAVMKEENRSRVHVLVIGNDNKAVGLIFSRVTQQTEIVVRSIKDPKMRIPGVVGATELGDGRPVLILDPEALIKLELQSKEATSEGRRKQFGHVHPFSGRRHVLRGSEP
jgi:two-component system chemotaxis sensor kinase CheA